MYQLEINLLIKSWSDKIEMGETGSSTERKF